MNELTQYLKTRRSALSLTLEEPGPNAEQIQTLIEIATRVPDHGKLAPWRFVLWEMPARQNMNRELLELLAQRDDVPDRAKLEQSACKLLHAPCVIAAISTAGDHPKVPEWEQVLSAGAACQNMLIGANSLGFDAQWLTAWYIYEDDAKDILQLADGERIAGIIHIGTSCAAKTERPRPEISSLFSTRSK